MLREFPTLVGDVDDEAYVAQIWAREMSGLTPIYLEGAFGRSRPVRVSAV